MDERRNLSDFCRKTLHLNVHNSLRDFVSLSFQVGLLSSIRVKHQTIDHPQ